MEDEELRFQSKPSPLEGGKKEKGEKHMSTGLNGNKNVR